MPANHSTYPILLITCLRELEKALTPKICSCQKSLKQQKYHEGCVLHLISIEGYSVNHLLSKKSSILFSFTSQQQRFPDFEKTILSLVSKSLVFNRCRDYHPTDIIFHHRSLSRKLRKTSVTQRVYRNMCVSLKMKG